MPNTIKLDSRLFGNAGMRALQFLRFLVATLVFTTKCTKTTILRLTSSLYYSRPKL